MWKKFLRNAERGQAIIIVAFAMVGLIGMVGLMTDGGIVLIEYGKLKRAIDSASIAASTQFIKNFQGENLVAAAQEFLTLNRSEASEIIIYRCRRDPTTGVLETGADGTTHAEDLCTTPRRKLVRVEAARTVEFGFMRVLGINSTTIRAASVGETASIDLVLVIDSSASMSYETGGDGTRADSPLDDPSACNFSTTNPCEPMNTVKDLAVDFVEGDFLFFPYDRVSVVTMTSQVPNGTREHATVLQLSDSLGEVVTAIDSVNVFQPAPCNFGGPGTPGSPTGSCLNYPAGTFAGLDCIHYRNGPDLIPGTVDDTVFDISPCNSSNIGGALRRAVDELALFDSREDSFWAIILLAGGPANATDSESGFPYGYCPPNTWNDPDVPFCRDAFADTRHFDGDADYDADDDARRWADYAADPTADGQGITVFTIGLGNLVRNANRGDADAGEQLLVYIAECAGEPTIYGDSPSDPCPPDPDTRLNNNHGFYRFTPDTAGLDDIFEEIASNIYTRISQ